MMSEEKKPIIFLCDFDGTITPYKLADFLYENFAECGTKYSDMWAEGKIGTREEIELSFRHITASQEQMELSLSEIPIDACFKPFIDFCKQKKYKLAIVSDGLEWAIRFVLKNHDITNDIQIFANQILFTASGYKFNFPYYRSTNPDVGVYKPAILNQYKKQGYKVVLIGDGKTDMEAAPIADFVFARDELLRYCNEMKIPSKGYQDFCEIITFLNHREA